MQISRQFVEISETQLSGEVPEEYAFDVIISSLPLSWSDLITIPWVVLVAPAGAGKTYECRQQCELLKRQGRPSFFVNLVDLASAELEDVLTLEEQESLEQWKLSKEEAFFFLDSVDELSLTTVSLRLALKKIHKNLGKSSGRAHFVVTTRPVVTELSCLNEFLKNIVRKNERGAELKAEDLHWRLFRLQSLTTNESQALASIYLDNTEEIDSLFRSMERASVEVDTPLDLEYLCEHWNKTKALGSYSEYIKTTVESRVHPHENGRKDRCALSQEKAIDGAERLAVAAHMMVTIGIRSNKGVDAPAIDPQKILTNWNAAEVRELLERPLFEFLSEGRVRFFHRSASEYLAAQHILKLIHTRGWSANRLNNLWFADIGCRRLALPSKREVLGWLSPKVPELFRLIVANQPELFLQMADPAALSSVQREEVLDAFCQRYKNSGSLGCFFATQQIKRFADSSLSECVNRILSEGVANPDVLNFLFELMIYGDLDNCQEFAWQFCVNENVLGRTRTLASCVLAVMHDKRLQRLLNEVDRNRSVWTDEVIGGLVGRLYPQYMTEETLVHFLKLLDNGKIFNHQYFFSVGHAVKVRLNRLERLSALRDQLVLVVRNEFTYLPLKTQNKYPWLCELLMQVALKGELHEDNKAWRMGIILGQLGRGDRPGRDIFQQQIEKLPLNVRLQMFIETDDFIDDKVAEEPAENRFCRLEKALCLTRNDREWLESLVTDQHHDHDWLKSVILPEFSIRCEDQNNSEDESVSHSVTDVTNTDVVLNNTDSYQNFQTSEPVLNISRKSTKQYKDAKEAIFIGKIKADPKLSFSPDNFLNTVNNLESFCSGWIQEWQLNEIRARIGANAFFYFEQALKRFWRSYRPKLPWLRKQQDLNVVADETFLGRMGLKVESIEGNWLNKLTDKEAQQIFCYLPGWTEEVLLWRDELVKRFPTVAKAVYAKEVNWELTQLSGAIGLQGVLPLIMELEGLRLIFAEQLRDWLDNRGDTYWDNQGNADDAKRLHQILTVVDAVEETDTDKKISEAEERLRQPMNFYFQVVWVSRLFKLNENKGLTALENVLKQTKDAKVETQWFAELFGDVRLFEDVSLQECEFSAKTWRRLTELAYTHVPESEDSAWAPGVVRWCGDREFAQKGRSFCLDSFMKLKGKSAYLEKLQLLAQPQWKKQKGYLLYQAEKVYLESCDRKEKDEASVTRFESDGLVTVTDNRSMAVLLEERLSEVEEWLKTDTCSWKRKGRFEKEVDFRRDLADKLMERACGLYHVPMESVTCDEQETDIRLAATGSHFEAVLELKLGKNYSGCELKDTIREQLVAKYLAPATRRVGALVIAVTNDKNWENPETKEIMNAEQLERWLQSEVDSVQANNSEEIFLSVYVWDCRPKQFNKVRVEKGHAQDQNSSVLNNRSRV